jgi:hypothetical protein
MKLLSFVLLALTAVAPDIPACQAQSKRDRSDGGGHDHTDNAIRTTGARCRRQKLSIPVSTQALTFDVTKMQVTPDVINQTTIDALFLQVATDSNAFVAEYINGTHTVAQTFSIEGVLCTPGSNATNNIQLLTHGIGTSNTVSTCIAVV